MANKIQMDLVVNDKGSKTVDKFSKGSRKSLSDLTKYATATAAAFTAIGAASLKLGRLYSVQLEAEKKLASQLRRTGQFSEAGYKGLLNYASSLQKVSKFGDEAIIPITALLNTMGVASDQLKVATSLTLDFASAMNMDLQSAARIIARVFEGDTSMLKRYGITIGENEDAVKRLLKAVGGAKSDEAGTLNFALAQMHNSLGDLGEVLGQFVVPWVIEFANKTKAAVEWWQKFLSFENAESAKVDAKRKELRTRERIAEKNLKFAESNKDLDPKAYQAAKEAYEKVLVENRIILEGLRKRLAVIESGNISSSGLPSSRPSFGGISSTGAGGAVTGGDKIPDPSLLNARTGINRGIITDRNAQKLWEQEWMKLPELENKKIERMKKINVETEKSIAVFEDFGQRMGDTLGDLITGSIEFEDAWKQVLNNLISEIGRIAMAEAKSEGGGIFGSVLGGLGDLIPGGIFGGGKSGGMGGVWTKSFGSDSMLGLGFADGGVVNKPTLGMIGEGAYNEAVVPLPDGKSIPVKMNGGGGGQNITYNIMAMDSKSFTDFVRRNPQAITATLHDSIAKGDQKLRTDLKKAVK